MSTTPLWLTLVLAVLSPASALFGVWLTQRRADRREDATFARELAKERARWQREDEALTFEHRRAAYAEFYEALRKMGVRVHNHGYGLCDECEEGDELPFDWNTESWEKLQHLELYATPEVAELALKAYTTTWHWGHNCRHDQFGPTYSDDETVADVAKDALLQAIRTDLNVPSKELDKRAR